MNKHAHTHANLLQRVSSVVWRDGCPCCICSLAGSCSLSRCFEHVDALGQISSNKSAAQGLIAQTDNALIQCCVSGSGCCCCCCWLVYKSYGAGLIWRSIRCKSTHKLLGDVFAFDIAAEYRNISIRLLHSYYCWITVRLPRSAGLSTRQALFGAITQQTEARAGRPGRQAGGSHGM